MRAMEADLQQEPDDIAMIEGRLSKKILREGPVVPLRLCTPSASSTILAN